MVAVDTTAAVDIEAHGECADPVASEARFRGLPPLPQGDERLEVLTQIAGTYGPQYDFPRAHRRRDDVARQPGAAPSRRACVNGTRAAAPSTRRALAPAAGKHG